MRVIGVDPGLRRMGWGVVDVDGVKLRHVANGVCQSDGSTDLASRLAGLFRQLEDVVNTHKPATAAVEQTFVNKDAAGTLKLGQARGVAMLVPALCGIDVAEYAPNAVKKAVVGVGHAQKEQIQHMVGVLLPGAKVAGPDAADALAIAICHAYQADARSRMAAAVAAAR
ncbi:MAG: crossover junction endodeoxyribonuclease RuvC [Pseudomonadota bacterium]